MKLRAETLTDLMLEISKAFFLCEPEVEDFGFSQKLFITESRNFPEAPVNSCAHEIPIYLLCRH